MIKVPRIHQVSLVRSSVNWQVATGQQAAAERGTDPRGAVHLQFSKPKRKKEADLEIAPAQ